MSQKTKKIAIIIYIIFTIPSYFLSYNWKKLYYKKDFFFFLIDHPFLESLLKAITSFYFLFFTSIIYICLILYYIAIKCNKLEMDKKIEDRKMGIYHQDKKMKYLGGFPTIEGDKPCSIEVRERELALNIDNSIRLIKYSNIKDARIISKEQLSKEVSLGKFLVFGWLALAMKDDKLTVKNLLKIDYNNGEETLHLIFTSDMLEYTCTQIRRKLNKAI